MSEYSAFDVLGPIMIGPSSSHTAGACRISNLSRKIVGEFDRVRFDLHGSFSYTYRGHGTDRALLAGLMGFEADDPRIKNSFEIASEKGLSYSFERVDLGEGYQPNTVKIVFFKEDGSSEYVIGTSMGGGAISIVNIDGMRVDFNGKFPLLLLQYPEQTGIISYVSSILGESGYNIEFINTDKDKLTEIVTLRIDLDRPLTSEIESTILNSDKFTRARYVEV